jgi:Proteasome assembly chaperone 4
VTPRATLLTTLHSVPGNIDYATRIARVLVRRMNMPVYVGCSIDTMGSTIEEETEGFAKIVEAIMEEFQRRK